jgi:hypothetical protein
MNSYTLSLEELKLALILAHASAFVYHPEMKDLASELKNKTGIDFKEPFHLLYKKPLPDKKLPYPDISGFLGTYQDYMLIVFRGSYNTKDWITNVRFWQNEDIHTPVEKDNFPGKVHNGFAQSINENWHELQSLVEKYSNKSSKLLLTGHSLGGALAVLTSNRLISSTQHESIAVYTYGAPRVGDLNFKKAYKPTHYRFEYGNDPVPHVPLPKLLTWEHTGQIRYLPKPLRRNQVDILCEDPKSRMAPIYRSTGKSGVGVARVVQGMMSVFKNRDLNKGIEYIRQGIDVISKSNVELALKEHDIQSYINHIESYWKDKYRFDYLEKQLHK